MRSRSSAVSAFGFALTLCRTQRQNDSPAQAEVEGSDAAAEAHEAGNLRHAQRVQTDASRERGTKTGRGEGRGSAASAEPQLPTASQQQRFSSEYYRKLGGPLGRREPFSIFPKGPEC